MKPAEKQKVMQALQLTAQKTAALTRANMARGATPQGLPPGIQNPLPQAAPPRPAGPPPTPPMMKKGGKVEGKWPFEGKQAKSSGTKAKPKGSGIATKGFGKGKVR